MIRAKVLGRNHSIKKVVKTRLVGYFLSLPTLFRPSPVLGTQTSERARRLQVFCFGKAICQLNVYRGNPRDGCYFHQEGKR